MGLLYISDNLTLSQMEFELQKSFKRFTVIKRDRLCSPLNKQRSIGNCAD